MIEIIQKARQGRNHYPAWLQPEVVDDLLTRVRRHYKPERWELEPVTVMSQPAYTRFLEEGEYKTIYQTGPTWHKGIKTARGPLGSRRFNDLRLYGAEAPKTVYAVGLSHTAQAVGLQRPVNELRNYLQAFCEGLPPVYVFWDREVLRYATFTYGDSQQNVMTYGYDPVRVWALGKLYTWSQGGHPEHNFLVSMGNNMRSHLKALFLQPNPQPNPYFECQIHHKLTPTHVAKITS